MEHLMDSEDSEIRNETWETRMFSPEEFLSPILSQYSQNSQSQSQRVYSGLLSKPELKFDDFGELIGSGTKMFRNVQLSNTFQPYRTADFLAYGEKPRPSSNRRVRKQSPVFGSRCSRTFQSRLQDYRPILESKVSKTQNWATLERFPDIISLSTLSPAEIEESRGTEDEELTSVSISGESMPIGFDDDQGIGFKEYDRLIVLIGYLVKQAQPKPGHVLRLCSEIGVIPMPLKPRTKPGLFLQDKTAQIRLAFPTKDRRMKFTEIVSGIPVALQGKSRKGKFYVQDVLFATPPNPEWPFSDRNEVEMIFVSSLSDGGGMVKTICLDLLFDYLQGLSGSPVEQEKMLLPKTRVFFIGNLFRKRERWNANFGEKLATDQCEIADNLDNFLENVSQTMEVFVVPGENDPTHQIDLPQPPIHRQIFSDAAERPTFHLLTNPAKVNLSLPRQSECDYEDFEDLNVNNDFLNVVLSSGANVKKTMESCDIECPLEMSMKLLEWSHLHPTSVADNELAEDLFNLKDSLPHLFIVGGLSGFKVLDWNGVKIVGVPSFAKTATVVVFTKGCDIIPLTFKICM